MRTEATHSHDAEDDGKQTETHELNWLSSPGVDEQEGSPVSVVERRRRVEVSLINASSCVQDSPRDQTSSGKDQVSNTDIVELLVGVLSNSVSANGSSSESNGGKNDGRVESETVEGN